MIYNHAATAAEAIKELGPKEEVLIVTHHDADGITAGAIASATLSRLKIKNDIKIVPQIDEGTLKTIKDMISKQGFKLVWFTDIGSGSLSQLSDFSTMIITDHHEIDPRFINHLVEMNGGEDILDWVRAYDRFVEASENRLYMVNPHLVGEDGGTYVSGAGATYLVAKSVDKGNADLAALAIVGAVGDMQDKENNALIGLNRQILDDGVKEGVLEVQRDIRLYGRCSRPIFKMLALGTDPAIPGITRQDNKAMKFLNAIGIPQKDENGRWLKWYQLDKTDKKKAISRLVEHMITEGVEPEDVKRLVGEVYILPREEEGSELWDAKEYSTLINACSRYGFGTVAINVCLGNRDEWLSKARELQKNHKAILQKKIGKILESGWIKTRRHVQYFHAKGEVPDTILGTLAGMALASGKLREDLPIIAFTYTEDKSAVKVSSRASQSLVLMGLNLSDIMSRSAEAVGGVGGGHAISAGAAIPMGKEEEFLNIAEDLVEKALSSDNNEEEGEDILDDMEDDIEEEDDMYKEEEELLDDEIMHWKDDELE